MDIANYRLNKAKQSVPISLGVQRQSRDIFVLVRKSLRRNKQTTKQPPKYRAFQISFVGQGGQGKSGDWQLV